MPSIACVIPVYNAGRELERAVQSVLCQGNDVQLVVVDDASTDGTAQRVRELARAEQRIVALCLSQNRGQSNARNIGVAAAGAPYVTVLDQDDEHLPGWYRHAVDVLDGNPGYAALKGNLEVVHPATGEPAMRPDDPRLGTMVRSVMWNVVVRKPVFQAIGGCPTSLAFRTRQGNEDVAFMMALEKHFAFAESDYVSTRHYVQPKGATAYFLERTRVSGEGFEFLDHTAGEQDGSLQAAFAEFLARADRNIEELRASMR